MRGTVHGGQQPVVDAHVYLFAAGTSGYGGAAIPLISSVSATGNDALGNYVTTDSSGTFSVTGDYSCTADTQVYLLATGGNPGLPGNQTNPALALMTALGKCPAEGTFANTLPFVSINEVTTVASAFAIAGYMTDLAHVSSSGTTLSNAGMANAFSTTNNLMNVVTGTALATTPAGNGVVPQTEINTIANILASCVNSVGPSSSACSALFADTPNGVIQPTETVTSTLNLAHNPGNHVSDLFALSASVAPFNPSLGSVPNDFTIAINFTGGSLSWPRDVAIDGAGYVWVANGGNGTVNEFSSNGAPLVSTSLLSTVTGLPPFPSSIAVANSGNVWIASQQNSVPTCGICGSVAEVSPTGTILLTSTGSGNAHSPASLAIDGTDNLWVVNDAQTSVFEISKTDSLLSVQTSTGSLFNAETIAVDSNGNSWVANSAGNFVSEFSNTGATLSPSPGFTGGGLAKPIGIAIDHSGNAWIVNTGVLNSTTQHYEGANVTVLNSSGAALSPSTGYVGGGIDGPIGIALDGAGNAWVINYTNSTLSEFSSTGTAMSPDTGYIGGSLNNPGALAIDGSGNVWIANGPPGSSTGKSLVEFVGIATPVVTPLAAGVKGNSLGVLP